MEFFLPWSRRRGESKRAVAIPVHSPFSNFWRLPRAWRDPSGCCHFAFAARNPRHTKSKHSTSLKNHAVRTVIVASSLWRERLERGSKGPGEPKPPVVTARFLSSPRFNPHRTFPFPGSSVIIAPPSKDELSLGSRRHTEFISHPISRTITNRFDSSANKQLS